MTDLYCEKSEQITINKSGQPGAWRALLVDLKALPGNRQRLTLLKEYIFPESSYLLQKYEVTTPWLLPVLYMHRLVTGVWKRI